MRLSLIFGGLSLGIIVASAVFTYELIIEARMESFKQRLVSLAISISQTIDSNSIPELETLPDKGAAWKSHWHEKLLSIVHNQPDIDSIYILCATDQPAQLRFLIDASKVSRVASNGELYNASEFPYMLNAFTKVQVEDRIYSDEFGATQSGYAPLRTSSGEVAGIVGVDVLAVRLDETREQVLRFCLILFGLSALAIVGLAFLVRHLVRKPIRRVLRATDEISAGRYKTQASVASHDEFGILGERIDLMARQLQEREHIRAMLGIYMSSDLAHALLSSGRPPELGGTESLATVVFCDLAQYTRVCECFIPTEIISLINEYLGAITEVIEEHGGCVLDFTGDGIMAVFGAPVYHRDHAERAVRCALRMQLRMKELNESWESRNLASHWKKVGIDEILMRVGIHSGPIVAGNIGSNSRMRYSIMGDTVNVAARLEKLNKELLTRIAISEEVRQRCSNEIAKDFIDCDLRLIRGRKSLMRVYAV